MRKKLSKKTINILWIIAIFLSITSSIIVIGGKFNLLNITNPDTSRTDIGLLGYDDTSASYSFDAILTSPISKNSAQWDTNNEFVINAEIPGDRSFNAESEPPFINGLIENEYFKATNLDIDAFAVSQGVDIGIVQNFSEVKCKILNKGMYNGYNRSLVTCKFNVIYQGYRDGVHIPCGFYGFSHLYVEVTIPKIGYCQPGLNQCLDGTCKEDCNECPIGQTKCSDGICKDSCDENGKDDYTIYFIALIIIGIIVLMTYIYKKRK